METSEVQLDIQNLEEQRRLLRLEIEEETKNLSSIYSKQKDEALVLKDIQMNIRQANLELKDIHKKQKTAISQIHRERIEHQEATRLHDNSISAKKFGIQSLNRDLKKLNNWILAADDEKKKKSDEILHLDEKISGMQEMAKNIIFLQDKKQKLQNDIDTLISIYSEKKVRLDDELKIIQQKVDGFVEYYHKLEYDISVSKNSLDDYNSKLGEYLLVVNRIEEKYKETFPELRFPIY